MAAREEGGSGVVTMVDVLEQQAEIESDAAAVLGASDDGACTWPQGYVARQALYACLTCAPDNTPNGLCLACSLACHDGHELLELYTKRRFRCDCGRPDLPPCAFGGRRAANAANRYSHNFSGRYCTCRRPYPDPDPAAPADSMHQCALCEDWLHKRHLGEPLPDPRHYEELTCAACVRRHPFLLSYLALSVRDADFSKCDRSVDDSVSIDEEEKPPSPRLDKTVDRTQTEDVEMPEIPENADSTAEKPTATPIETTNADKEKTAQTDIEPSTVPKVITAELTSADSAACETNDRVNGDADKSSVGVKSSDDVEDDIEGLNGNAENPIESSDKTETNEIESSDLSDVNNKSSSVDEAEGEIKTDACEDEPKENVEKVEIESDGDGKSIVDGVENGDGSRSDERKIDPGDERDRIDSPERRKLNDADDRDIATGAAENGNSSRAEKRKTDDEIDRDQSCPSKKQKLTDGEAKCTRPAAPLDANRSGAIFWPADWRTKLCTCPTCHGMYEESDALFLLDPDDTVTAYENLGKAKASSSASQYEKGLEALSSLDRIQQINAITEYNKMKEKLHEFLTTFKDKREVVKEEDIKDFFAGMKPKREPDGVYFCR